MDTALPQKFPFILDRNLAKANCTENQVCTSCDTVVFGIDTIKSTECDDDMNWHLYSGLANSKIEQR